MRLGRFELCFKPVVDCVIFLTGRKQYEMSTHHPNASHRPEPGFPVQIKRKCRFYIQGMVHINLSVVLVWQGWWGGLLFPSAGSALTWLSLSLLIPDLCWSREREHSSERAFKDPIGFMIVEKYGKIYRIGQKKRHEGFFHPSIPPVLAPSLSSPSTRDPIELKAQLNLCLGGSRKLRNAEVKKHHVMKGHLWSRLSHWEAGGCAT